MWEEQFEQWWKVNDDSINTYSGIVTEAIDRKQRQKDAWKASSINTLQHLITKVHQNGSYEGMLDVIEILEELERLGG